MFDPSLKEILKIILFANWHWYCLPNTKYQKMCYIFFLKNDFVCKVDIGIVYQITKYCFILFWKNNFVRKVDIDIVSSWTSQSCIPCCPNLVPCIHLPTRQILSIDRHHFQWNTDTEVRYEIILVCKWKYRILRSFGNEIKLAGITTRWLRGPILEQRFVALIKRMLHLNKSTLVDVNTMRKGLFCVNFIQRVLRLFLRLFTVFLCWM